MNNNLYRCHCTR